MVSNPFSQNNASPFADVDSGRVLEMWGKWNFRWVICDAKWSSISTRMTFNPLYQNKLLEYINS